MSCGPASRCWALSAAPTVGGRTAERMGDAVDDDVDRNGRAIGDGHAVVHRGARSYDTLSPGAGEMPRSCRKPSTVAVRVSTVSRTDPLRNTTCLAGVGAAASVRTAMARSGKAPAPKGSSNPRESTLTATGEFCSRLITCSFLFVGRCSRLAARRASLSENPGRGQFGGGPVRIRAPTSCAPVTSDVALVRLLTGPRGPMTRGTIA